MPNSFGPHLLGRKAPAPDSRDYNLADYLQQGESVTGDDLDRALHALLNVKGAAATTKAFAQAVTTHVRNLENSVGPSPKPVQAVLWDNSDGVLDQGDTRHCVGFGCTQFGNTEPVDDHWTNAVGHAVYYEAKVIDGEPKAEDGSSVHSGVKALKNRGRVGTYAWSTKMEDIKAWVLTKGPVIVGTDWTNDMFKPDTNGFVRPTGSLAGGHCYLIIGWDDADNITFLNSWSRGWGLGGRFKMAATDFTTLIRDGFEACAVVELPSKAVEAVVEDTNTTTRFDRFREWLS